MPTTSTYRKPPRTPPGCDDHLTRQQAAQLLGFSSEFKIRQLEREGRLQSVRGPMRTAFYARADVLALKAELGREVLGQEATDGWTDAELLLLLRTPNREGRQRTALDLVLETRISIDRAERVFAFWAASQSGPVVALAHGQLGGGEAEASRASTPLPQAPKSAPPSPGTELALTEAKPHAAMPPSPAEARPVKSETSAPRSSAVGQVSKPAHVPAIAVQASSAQPSPPAEQPSAPATTTAPASTPVKSELSAEDERRGEDRLSRDALIAQLRDPDPRVRDRAFALLKELQAAR